MSKTHHHKSKRKKLSTKYNIQKKVREHKRRLKKEAKKMGVKKGRKKDPGIPNSWPFKAQMLQELEVKKEKKEKEIQQKRQDAKQKNETDRQLHEEEKRAANKEREAARRRKRLEQIEQSRLDHLRLVITRADVLLQVLDARDPQGCRCAAVEAYAQENGRKIIFVLTKADLVAPQAVAQWIKALGSEAPTVAVQAEAGREGIRELLAMLGRTPPHKGKDAPAADAAVVSPAQAVAAFGFPNTGKKALCRALRQEFRAPAKWLLEMIGRLQPGVNAASSSPATLHLVVRGAAPAGLLASGGATAAADALDEDTEEPKAEPFFAAADAEPLPLAVVKLLLERVDTASLMRRFRLPSFDGAEGFLRSFAKDRNITSKRGKEAALEIIARRFLAELPVTPGVCCAPFQVPRPGAAVLWPPHGTAVPMLEAAMRSQVEALAAREAGPLAGALVVPSVGMGPEVDISALLTEAVDDGDNDEAMDDESDDEDEEEEEEDGESDGEGAESSGDMDDEA
mmetsp:Transcript_22001/g.48623  ORF Transcript_22001/g.48623 Transcript_22001/m.48623 type:complete len:511 (-) Transcript_22001:189-1721(-)